MPEQLELSLPFEEIKKVAGRKYLRDNFTVGTRISYKIPFNQILIRGSNQRKVFDRIPELAESLIAHGQQEPFELDVLPDGRSFLKEGERRYRAYNLLIEQKRFEPESLVEFYPTKSDITEQDRMAQQYISNHLKDNFKPLESAGVAFNLKYNFGEEKSNEEVAVLMGNISRQTVDNFIALASMPDDLKNQVHAGEITPTDALAIVRSKKKLEKQAAKEEEKQAQSAMYEQPGYKDPLKDEMEELKQTELQASIYMEKQKEREQREQERLERDAVLIPVDKEKLTEHIGKRLAAPAYFIWNDEGVDNGLGGEVVVPRKEVVFEQGKEIDEKLIEDLLHKKVETVFVFKEVQAAPSVITEPIAQEEKSKFDESRPEIQQVQNCIKLADKLEAIVNKLDAPDGTKKDVADIVKWMQYDLDQLRTWIHSNKKQNKRDR